MLEFSCFFGGTPSEQKRLICDCGANKGGKTEGQLHTHAYSILTDVALHSGIV